jgi:hypothetical protein
MGSSPRVATAVTPQDWSKVPIIRQLGHDVSIDTFLGIAGPAHLVASKPNGILLPARLRWTVNPSASGLPALGRRVSALVS